MTSGPRPSRLRHVSVRLRVTADPVQWEALYGTPTEDVPDAIRKLIVSLVQESSAAQHMAIVDVRRDQL